MHESRVAHPPKLVFDRRESIFGVVLGSTDQIEELAMMFGRRGCNNFQIGEESVVAEPFDDLPKERTFAVILKVMNGEPSYNKIEGPSSGNGSSKFHSCRLTRSSPLNRSLAWLSMAGDESTATTR